MDMNKDWIGNKAATFATLAASNHSAGEREINDYYVSIGNFLGLNRVINTFDLENATHFDTKEEAESWANAHQEVIEVEE